MTQRAVRLMFVLAILINVMALVGRGDNFTPSDANYLAIGWIVGIWYAIWRFEHGYRHRPRIKAILKGVLAVFVAIVPLLPPILVPLVEGINRSNIIIGLVWGLLCIPGALLSLNQLYRGERPPKWENNDELQREKLVSGQMTGSGHALVWDKTFKRWGVKCYDCKTITWSLDDVKKRYCSHCQKWHPMQPWPAKEQVIEGEYIDAKN